MYNFNLKTLNLLKLVAVHKIAVSFAFTASEELCLCVVFLQICFRYCRC